MVSGEESRYGIARGSSSTLINWTRGKDSGKNFTSKSGEPDPHFIM